MLGGCFSAESLVAFRFDPNHIHIHIYIYTYILYYIIYYIYYIYLLDSCRTMQKLIVVGWIARQQGKSKDSQMAMSVTRKYVLPLDEIWVLSHLKQQ